MPESPRWLYANNRRDEARVIVEKMAAVNGTKISKSVHESLAMVNYPFHFFQMPN